MAITIAADLAIDFPLVQAPMAGGATTPELVAAVSEAGALGSLGAGMMDADQITAAALAISQRTSKPFLINLYVISRHQSLCLDQPIPDWLQTLYQQHNMAIPQPTVAAPLFNEQFEAALAAKPAAISFTFGLVGPAKIHAMHQRGIKVIGTATSPNEAWAWQHAGADAIVLQGVEAGGHYGQFLPKQDKWPLIPLISRCKNLCQLPLWAAGGMMTGAQMAAVEKMGAVAAQMGTVFLTTDECGIHPVYKIALLGADERTKTRHTRLFSGKMARGIVNRFVTDYAEYEDSVPLYPQQNAYTKPLREAAALRNDSDELMLWAGEGLAHCDVGSVADLMTRLQQEYNEAKNLP